MDVSRKRLSVYKYNLNQLELIANILFTNRCNLLDLLNEHKVSINQSCGGHGICTTCRIIIHNGVTHERSDMERERASERRFLTSERLACQLEIFDNIEIIIL